MCDLEDKRQLGVTNNARVPAYEIISEREIIHQA